jgi:hypothetical protein
MSDNQADGQGSGSPFDDSAQQEVVRLAGRTDKDGASYAHATLTPASDTRPKEIHCDVRPIIPVIFLPGVMGSQLANKETGGELFFAPNTDTVLAGVGALGTLIELWFTGASSRERNFDPTQAAVTPLGPINIGKHSEKDEEDAPNQFIDEAEARRRGWGSVHRTSYHPILAWLEQQLNEPMHLGELTGAWINPDPEGEKWTLKPLLGTPPADYGAFGKGEALTEDSPAFTHFSKFRYRLYAIGYNWLQSNADSAKQVIEGSDYYDPKTKKTTRLMGIREICAENHTGKAILLTHSMGGLVARMGIAMHGAADLLHGVFHNVQPATGAPVAAKRFRTGGGNEGGINSFVNGSLLGRDANEFTAVLANAPGPLELIPMPDYKNGEPWWIFTQLDGTPVMQLPAKGNAFTEIYTNSKWFGLLPDEKLLDPAGIVKARLDKNHETQSVLEHFYKTVRDAVVNQNNIIDLYHDRTYVAYGDGALGSPATSSNDKRKPKTEKGEARDALLTWGRVIWKGNMPSGVTEEELRTATLLSDSHTGTVRVYLESRKQAIQFEVQKVSKLPAGSAPSDPAPYDSRNGIIAGDGTVPVWSAEAQARGLDPRAKGDTAKGVQMAFVQHGYNHQFSYNHPWTRWAVLYSIVQLAQDAPYPSC